MLSESLNIFSLLVFKDCDCFEKVNSMEMDSNFPNFSIQTRIDHIEAGKK